MDVLDDAEGVFNGCDRTANMLELVAGSCSEEHEPVLDSFVSFTDCPWFCELACSHLDSL